MQLIRFARVSNHVVDFKDLDLKGWNFLPTLVATI